MKHLQKELDSLLSQFPDETEIRNQLESLISVYPFNDYEYIISTLLGSGILTLDVYHRLLEEYVTRNRYLEVFQISGTRTFGETWAHRHLEQLAPELERPSKSLDPDYDQQYDFFLAGIRIEVKASRAVDAGSREPLYVKALSSESKKNFRMNFQQIKPALCDVFVWIGVWLDVIRYWVLSSQEVEKNQYFSDSQHRGNVGEGQLHLRKANISEFDQYEAQPTQLADEIRSAYLRQQRQA
ncbi:MAG: hypothetical protein OXI30_20940 [Chloroflexota bacterium]|nr:hypothetical protein [Chloroflexota bacterium]